MRCSGPTQWWCIPLAIPCAWLTRRRTAAGFAVSARSAMASMGTPNGAGIQPVPFPSWLKP